MGPTHLTSSSTCQVLKRLPPVINLHQTKPSVHERLQVLVNPLTFLPKLTSKLDEILASSRLVAKHSHKARVLFHSDQIM